MNPVKIGNKFCGQNTKPYTIAEIGINHNGSLETAFKLIDLAVDAGFDAVKFQKRDPVSSTSAAIAGEPHPSPFFSYGKTYLEHSISLEFSIR